MDLTATIGSSSVGCSLTIKALKPLRRFARVKHLLFGFFSATSPLRPLRRLVFELGAELIGDLAGALAIRPSATVRTIAFCLRSSGSPVEVKSGNSSLTACHGDHPSSTPPSTGKSTRERAGNYTTSEDTNRYSGCFGCGGRFRLAAMRTE